MKLNTISTEIIGNAVIKQAVKDYKRSYKYLKNAYGRVDDIPENPNDETLTHMLELFKDSEEFFYSDWCYTLTGGCSGDFIIEQARLKAENEIEAAKEKERRKLERQARLEAI